MNNEKKNINANNINYFENNENEYNNLGIKKETGNENDDDGGVEFERCFDCNYFWINNIIR